MHGWIFHNTNLGCRKTKLIAPSVTAKSVNKVLNLSNMGVGAVRSHSVSKYAY